MATSRISRFTGSFWNLTPAINKGLLYSRIFLCPFCMQLMLILIKVSDISNEARPMEVAEPWLDCLLQEFYNQVTDLFCILGPNIKLNWHDKHVIVKPTFTIQVKLILCCPQSDVEKLEGLPVTPFMDRDKITKPSSQTGFIRFVLLPLFRELANLFPCLEVITFQ